MKRHISPLSRHLSDAYKDVRGVKVTMKEGKYALHRPCCLLYTDATFVVGHCRKISRGFLQKKIFCEKYFDNPYFASVVDYRLYPRTVWKRFFISREQILILEYNNQVH